MSHEVPEQYLPRLCHVVKWKDFQGYGFNLHAEKGKAGQFIGKVDEHSPAEAAGLKEGDRIVEVNGINIGNENHQQVVARIKSGGEETRLLVVDSETDEWYKEQKRIIRGDAPEVRFISSKRNDDEEDINDEPAGYGQINDDHDDDVQRRDSNPEPQIEESAAAHVSAPVHNGSDAGDEDYSYRPRLCHLKIWPHFQGYGFNLHAERDKPGQFIGLVDDNSPASTAGLRVQDRIIEVNEYNVEGDKHTEVIARIKAIPGECKLLVVDRETDNYYKSRGVTVSSSLRQTEYIVTPDATADLPAAKEENELASAEASSEALPIVDSPQHENNQESDHEEDRSHDKEDHRDVEEEIAVRNEVSSAVEEEEEEKQQENEEQQQEKEERQEKEEQQQQQQAAQLQQQEEEEQQQVPAVASEGGRENEEKPEEAVNGLKSLSLQSPSEPEHEFTVASQARHESPAASSAPAPKASDGLELNLSVAEMKERLKAKKRQDPRLSKVPFEQKYKEFQRM